MVTSCVTLFKPTGALRDERTTARETIKKRSGLGGKSKSVQTKSKVNFLVMLPSLILNFKIKNS